MRQIGLAQIALIDHSIECMARRLGPAVNRELFGRDNGLQILRIVTLHPFDEGDCKAAREKRIFAISFHAAPPARVAKEIDVRSPEGQALVDVAFPAADGIIVFGARFVRDRRSNPEHLIGIPHGRESDCLGEYSRKTRARATPRSDSFHQL